MAVMLTNPSQLNRRPGGAVDEPTGDPTPVALASPGDRFFSPQKGCVGSERMAYGVAHARLGSLLPSTGGRPEVGAACGELAHLGPAWARVVERATWRTDRRNNTLKPYVQACSTREQAALEGHARMGDRAGVR